MTSLENNLKSIKNKIISCKLLTRNILGIESIPDIITYKLWDWRDHYTSTMTFNLTKIDTGIPQTKLINGYTIIARIYPTNYINFRGLFGLFCNNDLLSPSQAGIVGLQYSEDSLTDKELSFRHFPGATLNRVTIPTSMIPLNNWYILAVSYDGISTGKAYINSTLIDENNTFNPLIPYNNVVIGISMDTGDNRYFKGQLSDFKIYNKCLSQEEISQIVNEINKQIQ